MALSSIMPIQVANAVNDLLDNCAQIQRGQNVLIVAAPDGLFGGLNLVDEQTVSWVQAGAQQRGANVAVLWVDMPVRPAVIWSEGKSRTEGWHVPAILRGAVSGADILINHAVDLSQEEEIQEWAALLREHQVPMVRNMAPTASLMASAWAQTPYELVSEIRFQTSALLQTGAVWRLTDRNGTDLSGTVNPGVRDFTSRRIDGLYRPFPEGVFPAFLTTDASGVLVFRGTNPIWARHIGIPSTFEAPVTIRVENGRMTDFQGGVEADTLRRFYAALADEVGEDVAYRVRGIHGGLHPHARITEHQCPDPMYRDFIEHHHWSSCHVHLGAHASAEVYPYNIHVTAEMRGATLQVGENLVWDEGRLTAAEHPAVRAIAEKYPGRPGLDAGAWR
jgi:hypothetical protein